MFASFLFLKLLRYWLSAYGHRPRLDLNVFRNNSSVIDFVVDQLIRCVRAVVCYLDLVVDFIVALAVFSGDLAKRCFGKTAEVRCDINELVYSI